MTLPTFTRRGFAAVVAAAALTLGLGTASGEAEAKDVMVVGIDISDTNSFDPARQFVYSAPITMRAAYETLVTMAPGDYETLRPLLATEWTRSDDGGAWLITLREGVTFQSGNPLTAADVKFSFERVLNVKDNPAELAANIASVEVVDDLHVKINMVDPAQPLMNLLAGPTFVITDSKTVMEHGGTAAADADSTDSATEWLNQNSAGTGPYALTKWERNAQVVLERNAGYWRDPAPFARILLQHIPESATQLLALERGDIDAALNLTPPQLDGLAGKEGINLIEGTSLDYVYMTLTGGAELSEPLSKQAARQAVAHAIDYDGMIEGLMGGYATRPPSFIPNGLGGATAARTEEFGYKLDLGKARAFLEEAGYPDGFSFDISYGNAAVAGTTYQLIAQKVQFDLSKVGITANLVPMDQANARTLYRNGELASTLTFWNPDGPEPWTWASASVQRVAKRVRWEPVPQETIDLVASAGGAPTQEEANKYYVEYMRDLVDAAHYLILFQPVYRVATSTAIEGWELTAAGWQVDLYNVKPAE